MRSLLGFGRSSYSSFGSVDVAMTRDIDVVAAEGVGSSSGDDLPVIDEYGNGRSFRLGLAGLGLL